MLLKDEELELVVYNVAQTENGQKLLGHLLELSGIHNKGITGTNLDIYNKGKQDFGLAIRELLLQYAFPQYVEILKKGVENEYPEQYTTGRTRTRK